MMYGAVRGVMGGVCRGGGVQQPMVVQPRGGGLPYMVQPPICGAASRGRRRRRRAAACSRHAVRGLAPRASTAARRARGRYDLDLAAAAVCPLGHGVNRHRCARWSFVVASQLGESAGRRLERQVAAVASAAAAAWAPRCDYGSWSCIHDTVCTVRCVPWGVRASTLFTGRHLRIGIIFEKRHFRLTQDSVRK